MIKIKKLIFALLLCFAATSVYAAELNISVDKNVLTEADTLFLTIEYTGNDDQKPDISPLNDNFRVVSNSTSSQINFINGHMSQSKKWTLGLQPLKLGKINIPPLKLGQLISNSAEVEVKEVTNISVAEDYKENSNSPYFQMEQSLDVTEPYLQQQATLLVTIYDSIGLQDGSISISEESKKDWIVVPLVNQPIVRQEVINNKRMNVETYAFAIFAQKSGELPLPQLFFDGYYIKNSGFNFPKFSDDLMVFGVDFHNVFGQRVPVKMKTKNQVVNVKPIPDGYSAPYWLPLSDFNITSSWSAKNGFKVGEAVTRTFNLYAEGMTESMLPHFSFPQTKDVKQYPEKPEVSEKIDKGLIVTSAQINDVYIPMTPGELVIPEIKIDWFNVETNKPQSAVIPQETIFVLPNPTLEETKKEDIIEHTTTDSRNDNTSVSNDDVKDKNQSRDNNKINDSLKKADIPLQILYIAIGAGVAVILFLMMFLFGQKKKNNYKSDVIRSLRRHDYKKAREDLIIWAKDKYYPAVINNFNDISLMVKDDEFTENLSTFNKFLYSDREEFFDSAKFIEILKKVDKIKVKQKNNSETLPNLYD